MLRTDITPLNSECILSKLTNRDKIGGLSIVSSIASTNYYLKEKIKKDELLLTTKKPYSILIAEEQTAGRGRLGRTFYSPKGCGIYLSLAIKCSELTIDVMELTTITAVAISQAIEKTTKKSPKIKWVNDIFLNGKKICGILAEGITKASTGGLDTVILGIGLNYYFVPEELPEELKTIVGALYDGSTSFHDSVDRNELVAAMLENLFYYVATKSANKDYLNEYRKRSLVIGKAITIIQGEIKRNAYAVDIDSKGGLIVNEADGSQSVLSTGEVSIRL